MKILIMGYGRNSARESLLRKLNETNGFKVKINTYPSEMDLFRMTSKSMEKDFICINKEK